MNGFLLDTNVVSETTKPEPASQVTAFLTAQNDLWLSAIVLHELEFGLQLLLPGRRRDRIASALSTFIAEYEHRILPIGRQEARSAAWFRGQSRRSGRVLHLADALIAGTAQVNGLTIATRNIGDFDGLGIAVMNPWEPL